MSVRQIQFPISKQQEEQYYFERFRALSGLFAGATFDSGIEPEPDIILSSATGNVGIEVSRIYDEQARRQEGEQDATLELAQRIYEAQGLPSLLVGVFWSLQHHLVRGERQTIAAQLAKTVAAHLPEVGQRRDLDWFELPETLRSIIHSLDLDRFFRVTKSLWQPSSRAGFVRQLTQRDLQAEVSRKNAKFSGYSRARCPEVWLLLVIDTTSPASWSGTPQETRVAAYETCFDRLFLLSDFPREVIELKTFRL